MMFNFCSQDYFSYHPPLTKERQDAHDAINQAALHMAATIEHFVKDPAHKQQAIFALQQTRMFANLGITVDELTRSDGE